MKRETRVARVPRFETRRGGAKRVRGARPFNNLFKTTRHIYTTRWRSLTRLTRVYYTHARSHERACSKDSSAHTAATVS